MTTSLRITLAEFGVVDGEAQYFLRDIKDDMHEKIINYMYENYFLENKVFQHLGITDEPNAFENYAAYVRHILLNEMSIAIFDQHEKIIYGVILLKWMNMEWSSWSALLISVLKGKMIDVLELYKQFVLRNKIDKLDTMHIFDLYIDKELRTKEIYHILATSIMKVTQLARRKYLTTFTLTDSQRNLALEFGLEEISCIIYALYELEGENHGGRPFSCLRDIDEYQASYLKTEIHDYLPFYEMQLTKYRHQIKKKKKNIQLT